MKEICGCGEKTIMIKPQKYNPDDKYGEYRRKVKEPNLKKEGLL
jgi:rRNA maturation protein Nop10